MDWVILGMLVIACLSPLESIQSSETPEEIELAAALDRWERLDAKDYSFDYQQLCNCLPEAKGKVRIEMVDGEIDTITYVDDVYYRFASRTEHWKAVVYPKGTPVPQEHWREFADIADIMRNIQELMAEQPPYEYDAVYDGQTGIPCRVYSDWVFAMADDESEFVVSYFSFTPSRPELETGCAAGQNEFAHFPQPDYSGVPTKPECYWPEQEFEARPEGWPICNDSEK
ncbi:hypothetical protein BH24PSE2_BH24PSE2_13650 [soil metagenome]